ncbi:MAG: hypothetical protein AVDCRST_MAG33-709 [uncultured Thermomicrobiales bacterium]|uniref:Uncharacterized protein n=1 Tax=uncultured Thermomicrobiales bacterium TaxID=1645740 RepID=A0A6J4UGI6_9BACT|nr:MAG: hypothetical protein AVDCRST_MAG33-709 [uncultured Thermomicrobiales bacterium]
MYPITHPDQRVERLEQLLETFLRRYGPDHPTTRRITDQLNRVRGANQPGRVA